MRNFGGYIKLMTKYLIIALRVYRYRFEFKQLSIITFYLVYLKFRVFFFLLVLTSNQEVYVLFNVHTYVIQFNISF